MREAGLSLIGSWFVRATPSEPDQDIRFFPYIPEGKVGEPRNDDPESVRRRNRLHFDIRVGAENHPEVVAKLIARGATKLWDGRQGPSTWVTMADPEGNEFCVA